mgnify:CR=1 FL=1
MHDRLYGAGAAAQRRAGAGHRGARSGSIWSASSAISTATKTRRRVDEDLAEGQRNGVTGTPTLFVDGIRYDGAWDFYSDAGGAGASGRARVVKRSGAACSPACRPRAAWC